MHTYTPSGMRQPPRGDLIPNHQGRNIPTRFPCWPNMPRPESKSKVIGTAKPRVSAPFRWRIVELEMDSAGTYSGLRWSSGSTWLVSRPSDSFFLLRSKCRFYIIIITSVRGSSGRSVGRGKSSFVSTGCV